MLPHCQLWNNRMSDQGGEKSKFGLFSVFGHTFWQLFDLAWNELHVWFRCESKRWNVIFDPFTRMSVVECNLFDWINKVLSKRGSCVVIFVLLHPSMYIHYTFGQVGINTLQYIMVLERNTFIIWLCFGEFGSLPNESSNFDGITNNGLLSYFIAWLIIYHYFINIIKLSCVLQRRIEQYINNWCVAVHWGFKNVRGWYLFRIICSL